MGLQKLDITDGICVRTHTHAGKCSDSCLAERGLLSALDKL